MILFLLIIEVRKMRESWRLMSNVKCEQVVGKILSYLSCLKSSLERNLTTLNDITSFQYCQKSRYLQISKATRFRISLPVIFSHSTARFVLICKPTTFSSLIILKLFASIICFYTSIFIAKALLSQWFIIAKAVNVVNINAKKC